MKEQITRQEVLRLAKLAGFEPHKLPPAAQDAWIDRMKLFTHYLLRDLNPKEREHVQD